jgi:cysteinyl-tRNA synthetase
MLINAQNDIEKIQKAINNAMIQLHFANTNHNSSAAQLGEEFTSALNNDLNFPEAVTVL